MNERTAERRQAKEMVLKMMRANGMYDELRVSPYYLISCRVLFALLLRKR